MSGGVVTTDNLIPLHLQVFLLLSITQTKKFPGPRCEKLTRDFNLFIYFKEFRTSILNIF